MFLSTLPFLPAVGELRLSQERLADIDSLVGF